MNLVMFEAEVIDEILGKEPKENTEFLGTPTFRKKEKRRQQKNLGQGD